MLLDCSAGKILESPLDSKEIKPVNPKGNQPWIFTGRTDAEAEAPTLWPPDMKSRFPEKYPDAGKYWRQEGKRVTKDEMVDGITDSIDMNLSKLWETVKHREAWRAAIHGVSKSQTWLSDWTTVGKRGLLACSWQRPRKMLNILQCTGSPPATKNDLVQYINSTKVEKLFPR